MLGSLKDRLRPAVNYLRLPAAAKREIRRDRLGLTGADPGSQQVLAAGLRWIQSAQHHSISRDGGVARFYSLVKGWSSSYPETTGYLVPTLLRHMSESDDKVRRTTDRMLEWLLEIQFPEGGFPGGLADDRPRVPVTFNTGSVLLGLAAAANKFGDPYLAAMNRAATWLCETQDPDGCWRQFPSPFAKPGEKVQDTHVAWALLEAERVAPNRGYADCALQNVSWALSQQECDGWFPKCASAAGVVTNHMLGFVVRGMLESYVFSRDTDVLLAVRTPLDHILQSLSPDGHLPGIVNRDWSPVADWACLVGSGQIACCCLILHQQIGEFKYLRAGLLLNRYLRRTVRVEGPAELTGAIKGSFPTNGAYMPLSFLSPKFLIDALDLEAAAELE